MGKVSHDSETPTHGQQVITVCAFIHQNFDGTEKVFWPKRAATKKFLPDIYELPGGHVDFGEELVSALKREVYEEFGMRLEAGDSFAAFTYINKVKGSHSIEVIFFARFLDSIEKVRLNPEDHSTYGWFTEEEVEAAENAGPKGPDDDEIKAMHKAFALLRGENLRFS